MCGDTETKKGHFKMEGRPCKKTKRCLLLDVSTGSLYSFDQRNFWKQKLEDRMHRVEELDSRGSKFRSLIRKCC